MRPARHSFQPVTNTKSGSCFSAQSHWFWKKMPRLTAAGSGSTLPSCQLRPIAPSLWDIGAGPGTPGSAFTATPTDICSASPRSFVNTCCGETSSQLHWFGAVGPRR